MGKEDLERYLDEAKRLKIYYKDKIALKIGLELDYLENIVGASDPYYRTLGLDYIIGSVHMLPEINSREYLSIDHTQSETGKLIKSTFGGDGRLLVKEYYRLLRDMSEQGNVDIIGHLDVIKKTNIDSIYFTETEEWYRAEIEMTLECIADNNQILEVNTNKILHDPARMYPSPWILPIAKHYDIPIVLNADAHRPDRIDYYFEKAKVIISDAGYRELKVFIGDSWSSDKIV